MIIRKQSLPKISSKEYYRLHTDYVTALDLKIDVDQFTKEIAQYRSYFRQWGNQYLEYPRYGVPLCNLTGRIDDAVDPSCHPLHQWNLEFPREKYWDTDFTQVTEIFDLPSLSPLHQFRDYMIRSNILLWHNTARFLPHVDITHGKIDHMRLWGTTADDETYELNYGDHRVRNFEPGRLYLIDTIKRHSAIAHADNVYTFFLSMNLQALPILEKLLLTNH